MAVNCEEPKLKGVADIVFVLDVSGTMADIIEAVKDNIAKFVDVLLNDPQSTVRDVRLGLVTHDVLGRRSVHKVDFMSNADEFRLALSNAPDGHNEFGLPAVDCALDFTWRDKCRRYMVFFSDEPVSGGTDVEFQNSKLTELGQKMADLGVHFIGFNEENCPSYSTLGKTPGSSYNVVERSELYGSKMRSLLIGIAKTVSEGMDKSVTASVKRNLYNL